MGPAGPVKIFFVVKSLVAILTDFGLGLRSPETLALPQHRIPSLETCNLGRELNYLTVLKVKAIFELSILISELDYALS